LQHVFDDEGGYIACSGVGAFAQAGEIVVGNLDRRLGHQLLGGALNARYGNHGGLALLGRELVRQQRLARLHVGELNRLVGDVETADRLPRDREARTRQVARLRKIGGGGRAGRNLRSGGG